MEDLALIGFSTRYSSAGLGGAFKRPTRLSTSSFSSSTPASPATRARMTAFRATSIPAPCFALSAGGDGLGRESKWVGDERRGEERRGEERRGVE